MFRAQTKQAAPEPWHQHLVHILHCCLLVTQGLTSPPAASDSHVPSNPPSPSHCRHLIPCHFINHLHGHRYTEHHTSASLVVLMVKNPPAVQETWLGSIPRLGRSPGEGNGNPLQYSRLENSMDRGDWQAGCSPWGCKGLDVTERLAVSPLTPHLSKAASQETK